MAVLLRAPAAVRRASSAHRRATSAPARLCHGCRVRLGDLAGLAGGEVEAAGLCQDGGGALKVLGVKPADGQQLLVAAAGGAGRGRRGGRGGDQAGQRWWAEAGDGRCKGAGRRGVQGGAACTACTARRGAAALTGRRGSGRPRRASSRRSSSCWAGRRPAAGQRGRERGALSDGRRARKPPRLAQRSAGSRRCSAQAVGLVRHHLHI